MILAAIDIGSNAVRLLIMEASEFKDGSVDFTKLNFLRVPLRLGMDVFQTGLIGEQKATLLIDTMKVFDQLMKLYRVEHMKACATSAMRGAKNAPELIKRVKAQVGIDIQVISGSEEAGIIYETHIAENLDHHQPYLYIDVGGGSTELALFSKGRVMFKESFDIGTIRLLNDSVPVRQKAHLKQFVKTHVRDLKNLKAIGTGGNINKIRSMSRIKDKFPLTLGLLKEYLKELGNCTVEERMRLYNFRRDRADVIVPALEIYIALMRWAGIDQIFVPRIGLGDGLIRMLYQESSASA